MASVMICSLILHILCKKAISNKIFGVTTLTGGSSFSLEGVMTFTTGEIIAFVIGLLGAILTILNIIDKTNALKTMRETPFKTLSGKVEEHEVRIGKIESSLFLGNDRFREQEATNEVLLRSILALVEFEIQYCITENKPISKDLEKAKDDLHAFLSKR
jgi:hypothetical protein